MSFRKSRLPFLVCRWRSAAIVLSDFARLGVETLSITEEGFNFIVDDWAGPIRYSAGISVFFEDGTFQKSQVSWAGFK